jgi:3-oxoacyl-[acyl-carrier protein] reductase
LLSNNDDGRNSILVVGASGGIGSAIVAKLCDSPYRLIGLDRVTPFSSSCEDFININLDSHEAVEDAFLRIRTISSDFRAVIFAIGTYKRTRFHDYGNSDLQSIFWDNFFCVFFLLQLMVPELLCKEASRIVIVTSQAAVTGGADPGYAAAKGALHSFIKSIAREFARSGLRCNGVSPGPVDTAMSNVMSAERKDFYKNAIPIGRFSTAPEVAEAVAFLVLSDGNSINGAIIDVDGGLVRR